jgi:hypothetical protein
MNIPQLLEEAWDKKDWNIVDQVYNSLTGKHLCNTNQNEEKNDDNDHTVKVYSNYDSIPAKQNFKNKQAQTSQIRVHHFTNKYVDDRKTARQDSEFDRKVWAGKEPCVRRPMKQKIKIQCVKCLKYFQIYQEDLPPRITDDEPEYRCEKCLKI